MTNEEKLADEYRVKLGFKTWPEQEQFVRERFGDEFADGRRTGRTTRTILGALAYSVLNPDQRVILASESSFTGTLRDTVRSIATQLRLDSERIEVVTHAQADLIWEYRDPRLPYNACDRREIKFFSDHYDPQYDAALALVQLRDARRA